MLSENGTTDMQRLAELIDRHVDSDGLHATAVPRCFLIRSSHPTDPIPALHKPAVCFVAQGRKQVTVGPSAFVYDRAKYLVVSIEVPVVGQILKATEEEPYLCLRLDFEPATITDLILEANLTIDNASDAHDLGLGLSCVTDELFDSVLRLVRLLDTPSDIPMLAPLAEREVLYRLLCGDQASTLHQIGIAESNVQRIYRAIGWIKANFRAPFSIEAIAAEANLSRSALHTHFKTVTSITPLQYQKQLRLHEARRLILSETHDAATAGHSVGYESPSQFSREYKRTFGLPPMRDAARLRSSPAWQSSV